MPTSQIKHPESVWYTQFTYQTSRTMDRHKLQLGHRVVLSERFVSLLSVIDWPTNMAHFTACTETTGTKKLTKPLLKHMWKLQGTPRTIVYKEVCLSHRSGRKTTKLLVSDYTCWRLIVWGLTDNQISTKRQSRSIYIILLTITDMTARKYCQGPSFCTTTSIMCRFECPHSRQDTDTTPHTAGFHCPRNES